VTTPVPVTRTPKAIVVGRRKEAIVRVRLIAGGSGDFKLNGRTMENYFPNKVHQQLIREPFVTLEKIDQYDVPRVKERKKYGLKKARKAPQYSKR
jgi:small subunit ribosomal protein S9